MNLLKLLKEEIKDKNISDKLQIAQYIYVRIGQLFQYDPLWLFGTNYDRIRIKNKIIDIENINDFNLVCFSWARMYKELLENFSINCKIVQLMNHDNVQVFINKRRYLADLTASYEDITRIKFNMNTYFNCQISECFGSNVKEFKTVDDTVYERKIKLEEKLKIIKEKLKQLWISTEENDNDYVSTVFNLTCSLVNNSGDVGFVSGITFINYILKYFISDEYKPKVMHLWDNDNSYAKVYYFSEDKYFIYRKDKNGLFKFDSCNKEQLKMLRKIYMEKDIEPSLFSYVK